MAAMGSEDAGHLSMLNGYFQPIAVLVQIFVGHPNRPSIVSRTSTDLSEAWLPKRIQINWIYENHSQQRFHRIQGMGSA